MWGLSGPVEKTSEGNMFESLDERIELDESREYSGKSRMLHYLTIVAVSVVVVGAIGAIFQYVK
jgi:hypothetical protein